jgi:hypothetical protein
MKDKLRGLGRAGDPRGGTAQDVGRSLGRVDTLRALTIFAGPGG